MTLRYRYTRCARAAPPLRGSRESGVGRVFASLFDAAAEGQEKQIHKERKQKDAFKDHEQSGHLKTKEKVSLEVNKKLSQKKAEQYRLNTVV
jgi:hypothetical protein